MKRFVSRKLMQTNFSMFLQLRFCTNKIAPSYNIDLYVGQLSLSIPSFINSIQYCSGLGCQGRCQVNRSFFTNPSQQMPSLPISLYRFTIGKIQYRSTQFKCVNWNNKLIFDVIIKLQFSLKLSFYEYVRFGRTLSTYFSTLYHEK